MNKIYEIANKCHKCINANCSKHCPLKNNIPLICGYVCENNLDIASEILFRSNPFPYLTSKLCNHLIQCAGNCVFKNVDFYNLEYELGVRYFDKLTNFDNTLKDSDIVIIGGGITGLTIAHYLLKSGVKPTIYEKDKLGGVITTAIPDFRYEKTLFFEHIKRIEKKCNVIYKDVDNNLLNNLRKTNRVIISIGSEIETTSLNNDNVYRAIKVLKELNQGIFKFKNKKIGVIGLGNTACDVARSLKRTGNDVEIIYRRDIEGSLASIKEIEDLKTEGIKINTCLSAFDFNNGILSLYKNKLIQKPNESRKTIITTEEVVTMEFDLIIEAIGSKPNITFLEDALNSEYNDLLIAKRNNQLHYHTKDHKLFVGGDSFYGAWNIATAIASGLEIAKQLLPTYLFGGSFNPVTKAHYQIIEYLSSRGNLIIVPNGDRYELKSLVSFDFRKKMLEVELRKLSTYYQIEISEFEKSSFYKGTIETLRYYNHPIMVIGDDCLFKLDTWIKAETLVKENKFLVITREEEINKINEYILNNSLLKKYVNHFIVVDILDQTIKNLSSSDYRNNNNMNNISEEVLRFIENNKLYEV